MDEDQPITTTIRVPRCIWIALRELAACSDLPGRPSVSAVVTALVEQEFERQGRQVGARVE